MTTSEPPPGDDDPGSSSSDEAPPSRPTGGSRGRPRRRLRRVLLWSLAALVGVVGLAALALHLVLVSLGNPTLRDWVRGRIASSAGLDVTWDDLSVHALSGLEAEGLRIPTPAPYDAHAPTLLAIERVSVGWEAWSLMGGTPHLTHLELDGVRLRQVVDADGGGSLRALAARLASEEPAAEPEASAAPLSKSLARSALPPLHVEGIRVTDLRLERIEVEGDDLRRRVRVGPLSIAGALDSRPDTTPWTLELELSGDAPEDGVELALGGPEEEAPRTARLRLRKELRVRGPGEVEATLRLDLLEQDLRPAWRPGERLADVALSATFDPDAGRTELAVERLELLGKALHTTARIRLPDPNGGALAPTVRELDGGVDPEALAARLPPGLVELDLEGSSLTWQGRGLERREGTVPVGGTAGLEGRLDRLDLTLGARALTVRDGRVELQLARDDDGGAELEGELRAGALRYEERRPDGQLRRRLHLDALKLRVDASSFRDATGSGPLPLAGRVRTELHVGTARLRDGEVRARLDDARTELRARPGDDERWSLHGDVELGELQARAGDPGPRLGLKELATGIQVEGFDPATGALRTQQLDGGVERMRAEAAGAAVAIEQLAPDLEATLREGEPRRGDVTLRLGFERVEARSGETARTTLTSGALTVRGRELRTDSLPGGGDLSADLVADSWRTQLDDGGPEGPLELSLPTAELRAELEEAPTGDASGWSGSVGLGAHGIAVRRSGSGERVFDPPRTAELELRARELRLDAADPLRSEGTVELEARTHPLELDATLEPRGAEAPHVALDARSRSLDGLRDALAPSLAELAGLGWGGGRASVDVEATVAELEGGAPRLDQETRLRLHDPTLRGAEALDAELVALDLATEGDAARQELDVALRLEGARLDGEELGESVRLDADGDLRTNGSRFDLGAELSGPGLDGTVEAAGGPAADRLRWDASLRVADLAALAPLTGLVPGTDALALDGLAVDLDSRGRLRRLPRPPGPEADPEAVLAALERLRGETRTSLTLEGLAYDDGGGRRAAAEALELGLDLRAEPEERRLELTLASPKLQLAEGGREVRAEGLRHTLRVAHGAAVADGPLRANASLEADALTQSVWPGYRVGELSAELDAGLRADGTARLESLTLDNPRGGSRFEAEATLVTPDELAEALDVPAEPSETAESVPGLRGLELTAKLEQDLARLPLEDDGTRPKGHLTLPVRIRSADRARYRVAAELQAEDAHLVLPDAGFALEGLNGVLPVLEEVALGPEGGLSRIRGAGVDVYSMPRFQDVHPFLSGESWMEAERLRIAGVELGPLAGNARIQGDVVALDRLECDWGPGTVTGQLVVQLRRHNPRLRFQGNVTGIRTAGSDEVLDANASLVAAPAKREIEGRIEVVRVGRSHLRALLDVVDPYREDPDLNTLRRALKLGYPKSARLRMAHGFMAIDLQLGGLAGAIRIDEVRGISTGPLMEHFMPEALDRYIEARPPSASRDAEGNASGSKGGPPIEEEGG